MSSVAFVSLEIYPTTAGGAGILLHHTVQVLLEDAFEVVLLLDLSEQEFERFEKRDRAQFSNGQKLFAYRVDSLCRDLSEIDALYTDRELVRSVRLAHALTKLQQLHELSFIEFYDYCGPAYHFLARPKSERPPVIVRLHNTTELIERRVRSGLRPERMFHYAMERTQIALADLLLTPGIGYFEQEIKPLYSREFGGAYERVCHSPPVHFSIGEIDYSDRARNVLFYGRLSTFKGLDTFLRGAAIALRHTDFQEWLGKFVIVGPEETVASALTLDEMRSVIPPKHFARFEFVGRLDHARLIEVLRDVSFGCFANRIESFCYAAHELHTAGIPLILNDTPAFRDHFTDGDEALFFDGSAIDLAEQMVSLANDPEKRRALSARGLSKQQHYQKNFYKEHLAQLALQTATERDGESTDHPSLSIFILSNGDEEAELITCRSIGQEYEQVLVLRMNEAGQLAFAGRQWQAIAMPFAATADLLKEVGDLCIFFRAGDEINRETLRRMIQLMRDDRIGALGSWQQVGPKIRPALHLLIPELAQATGPGLRTLFRIRGGQTIVELLSSGVFNG